MTNLSNPTQEIWKDIPGYEGKYRISNYGKVISYSYTRFFGTNNSARIDYPEIVRKVHANSDGYQVVGLRDGKKEKKYKIHQLVALTFIPNPENKPEVNHKDANKQNNYVGNLEWVTHAENMKHCYANGLVKNKFIRKPAALVSKTCSKCNTEKPIEEFVKRIYKTGERGYKSICKSCILPIQRDRYAKRKKPSAYNPAKKVIDTSTGEIYDSIKSAAKKIDIEYGTLKAMLSGRNRNRTTLQYHSD